MNKKTLKIVLAVAALLVCGVACCKGGQGRKDPTTTAATEAPLTETPGTEAPVPAGTTEAAPATEPDAADGHITITVQDKDQKVLVEKNVGFKAGQTLADLLPENFANVTIDNGMLMTIESLTTPADWSSYIALFINGDYAMEGIMTLPFKDGDKIDFVDTVYIPMETTADESDGHITITVQDKDQKVLVEKNVGYKTGQTLADLLPLNFENVTIDNGMLMTIESLTTPADWSSYIALFINGEYAMEGIMTLPFKDGDKIDFVDTVYIPMETTADESDGHITITVQDQNNNVLAEKTVGFKAGQSLADLLPDNFENVTIDNGMLMTIENLTTPADFHTYIAFYINGEYAMEGVMTQPFADGDKIDFIDTVYIAP